jgi:hypothetical protein
MKFWVCPLWTMGAYIITGVKNLSIEGSHIFGSANTKASAAVNAKLKVYQYMYIYIHVHINAYIYMYTHVFRNYLQYIVMIKTCPSRSISKNGRVTQSEGLR